ncbi:MAG: hypothetical protein IKE78_04165 [Erysipelotrichaceae bacterium]|nr:hypothetical protein [Erysipelotrichaceae bacterium]
MDNYEELQDHEILLELLREKRERAAQQRTRTIIVFVLVACLAIALAICIPKVLEMYRQYNQAMKYIDTVYGQVEDVIKTYSGTFEKVAQLDVENVVKTLNDVSAFINSIFGGLSGN